MTNIQYHFYEIKLRFLYLIFSLLFTFFLSYSYQLEMVYILGKPFLQSQQTFIFLDLTEAFYTFLKISTLITILVSVPFFLYHIWSFFIPSFYKFEREFIGFFFLGIVCLYLIELLFIYFILLPKICSFLISFEITSEIKNDGFNLKPLLSIEFTARIESYITLLVKILILTLVLFQIPLCICLLYSKKILHVSSLYSNRKNLIFISLIISAFLVPPDVVSQLLVSFLFYCIFEFLIFIGLFFD